MHQPLQSQVPGIIPLEARDARNHPPLYWANHKGKKAKAIGNSERDGRWVQKSKGSYGMGRNGKRWKEVQMEEKSQNMWVTAKRGDMNGNKIGNNKQAVSERAVWPEWKGRVLLYVRIEIKPAKLSKDSSTVRALYSSHAHTLYFLHDYISPFL